MLIFDLHCDVLYKMILDSTIDFYANDDKLAVNLESMKQGSVSAQVFAVFIPRNISKLEQTYSALKMIDIFYNKIVKNGDHIKLVRNIEELENVNKEGKIAAILSLEGAEPLQGDIRLLHIFYQLGVRAIGLTWNYANEVADGVLEKRNGGLSNFGRELISEMNILNMVIDISHLSEKGFWDVASISKYPLIASHSNSFNITPHIRNLTDEQIREIIKFDGLIGITFVKNFASNKENNINAIIPHIEHIASLGGINNIAFGSDFDGAEMLNGIEHAGKYKVIYDILSNYYTDDQIKGFTINNAKRVFKKIFRK